LHADAIQVLHDQQIVSSDGLGGCHQAQTTGLFFEAMGLNPLRPQSLMQEKTCKINRQNSNQSITT